MFGIGFFEICIILLVGFLVLGPKEFIDFLKMGKSYYKKIQHFQDKMQNNIGKILDDPTSSNSTLHQDSSVHQANQEYIENLEPKDYPFGSKEFMDHAKQIKNKYPESSSDSSSSDIP